MSKVDKNESTGCWEWTAGKSKGKYGSVYCDGKFYKAHRVMYELMVAKIPVGMLCLHNCNNPGCINPDHLYIGTHEDNMLDVVISGSQIQSTAKVRILNADKVREIRSLRWTMSQQAIGKMFGVSQSTISQIFRGVSWGHIT